MATTLDRLVLAQLVYVDMRLVKDVNDIGNYSLNHVVIDKVYDALKNNTDTETITMEQLKDVLSRYELVDAVNLDKSVEELPNEQENGFYSAMFENISDKGKGELVYAIRGSDPGLTGIEQRGQALPMHLMRTWTSSIARWMPPAALLTIRPGLMAM